MNFFNSGGFDCGMFIGLIVCWRWGLGWMVVEGDFLFVEFGGKLVLFNLNNC